MTDAEILKLLASMGIDDLSFRVLPLLPLVRVAWADGEIQSAERRLIESTAEKQYGLGTEGRRVLKNWLAYPPSERSLRRGELALRSIAEKTNDFDLGENVLRDALKLSNSVAKATGGLWGLGAIGKEEKLVLKDLASRLDTQKSTKEHKAAAEQELSEPSRARVMLRFDTDTLDLGKLSGILTTETESDVQIPIAAEHTMGSAPNADIGLLGKGIDPIHCSIRRENQRFYVRDMESTQGTWVEQERIVERRLLGGELIQIGNARMVFKLLRRVPRQLLSED